jgi:CRP-like cAMP-binding protein
MQHCSNDQSHSQALLNVEPWGRGELSVGHAQRRKPVAPFVAPFQVCEQLEREATICDAKPGSFLFRRGEASKGVFVVLEGRVALSAGEDPTRIVRIAERGSLLGLPATVSGKRYSLTAEVVAQSRLALLPPARFKELLRNNPVLGLVVVQMLAEEVSAVRKLAVYKC